MNYSVLVFGKMAHAKARPGSDDRKTESEQRQAANEQIAAPLLKPELVQREPLRAQGGSSAKDQSDQAKNNEEHRRLQLPNRPDSYPTVK
jgi:hypothetical protein